MHSSSDRPSVRSSRREPRRSSSPTITVVVPSLNEADNLREILPELPTVHEVILVDGGSVDDSVTVARDVRRDIVTLTQSRTGKGNAMAAGFTRASGDVIVMFDADGSADPAEIDRFVDTLVRGADYAKGSRFLPGGASADITAVRKAGNRFLNTWMNVSFGTRFTDLCYGYNAFWADLVPVLALPDPALELGPGQPMLWGDGFEIETLITCRFAAAGLAITEVPSRERARLHGESNLHAVSDGMRVLHTLRTERARLRARDTDAGSGRSSDDNPISLAS